ncbi:AraC family transcriptional regulator [Leucobacter ruminantium]|uniref:Helix-turn-helix domain-containing protein n=1 Tax=Leucobacter ruminantium TaxID=1289170 RepID=A0A939LWL4_9MICO|nr:helix-turn-helix domain-containing protein [Leucobacter ruminantium]MBO1804498.1 helix-turn-helix domain-containing protein [Leucobacter ruminantium]
MQILLHGKSDELVEGSAVAVSLTYEPFTDLADPVLCLEASILSGVTPQRSPNFKTMLLTVGSCLFVGDFQPFQAAAGDLLIFPPGLACGGLPHSMMTAHILFVHPEFLVDQVRWNRPLSARGHGTTYRALTPPGRQPLVLRPDQTQLDRLHQLFIELASRQSEARSILIPAAAKLIWAIEGLIAPKLSGRVAILGSRRWIRDEVQEAVRLMHLRFRENLLISEIAQTVSMSQATFRRAFQVETGLSPLAYLRRIRLARFEELVAHTRLPLDEAARIVGWSPPHARAVFHQEHGLSPRAYRREQGLE